MSKQQQPGFRERAKQRAKAAKALIDPAEPRVDMGPRPFPSEAKMLEALERQWGSARCRTESPMTPVSTKLPRVSGGSKAAY